MDKLNNKNENKPLHKPQFYPAFYNVNDLSLIESNALTEIIKCIIRSYLEGIDLSDWKKSELPSISISNFSLHLFKKIRFRKPENIPKAMLSFLDTIALIRQSFFYGITRCGGECYLFVGIWTKNETLIREQSKTIANSIYGFFPGCETIPLRRKDLEFDENKYSEKLLHSITTKEAWLSNLQKMNKRIAITGIPAKKVNSEKNNPDQLLLGIEELVDSVPEDFFILVHAQPISSAERQNSQEASAYFHNLAHELARNTLQTSNSTGISGSHTETDNESHQSTTSLSDTNTQSQTEQDWLGKRILKNSSSFIKGGKQSQRQVSESITSQKSESLSQSKGTSTTYSLNTSNSASHTLERTNKQAAYLEELLNHHHKRLSSGAQLWEVFTEVCSNDMNVSKKIASLLCGILSGDENSLEAMRYINLSPHIGPQNFHEVILLPDHPLGNLYAGISSILTTSELCRLARLPLHDLPGIEVEKLADYGRNWPNVNEAKNSLKLGCLIDHEIDSKRIVKIDDTQFLRHCFVSGATGSGKSTTMRSLFTQLWGNHKTPFMVIEPVKREYRYLGDRIKGLKAFALGHKDCRFSINPFNFSPEVGLIPHIDLLKSAFQASLGMYSSMPFILEHIIYEAYKRNGWDMATSRNATLEMISQLFGFNSQAVLWTRFLPRLHDLVGMVDEAIANFFPQDSDYSVSLVGALKSRLNSLCQGAKGNLLDSPVETRFDELLESPVVLELWPFADNEEKAFIMAIILMRIYEFRQAKEMENGGAQADNLVHLLVIEEAHRLLAKAIGSGGEHTQQGRQKGVDVFADILAEIRSYGQGIVVVDQIPSKLVPDVLRNTDLKIAHRLVDKEDRSLIGATMNLDEEQTKDLARFIPGQACVYYSGLRKPLHVKIKENMASSCAEAGENTEPLEWPEWDDIEKDNSLNIDLWLAKSLCLFVFAPKSRFSGYVDNALNELVSFQSIHKEDDDPIHNQIGYAAIRFFDYLEECDINRETALTILYILSNLLATVFYLDEEVNNRLTNDSEAIKLFSSYYMDFQNLITVYPSLRNMILYYWLAKNGNEDDLLNAANAADFFGFSVPKEELINILSTE